MDDPVHKSLPCYMQAQQLSKSLTMESKPLWSYIWLHSYMAIFLIFWSSCKQTASCCVWKFCSSKFMCLMTNIRKSWLCFKILWLSFLSFWCLQFLPKNEWKQVDLRYHSSKVKFIRSFFGRIIGLNKIISNLSDL